MGEEIKKVPNEYGIIDPQYEKCNHHIKSKGTTIVLLDARRTFTVPEHVYGICKCCGKPFHYIRDEKGVLKTYKNKKEGD